MTHFGTMVCFHPRYALGDHHNYMDKDDFLREMYLNTVGNMMKRGTERYERMVNIVSSRKMTGMDQRPRPGPMDEAMQKVISEKYADAAPLSSTTTPVLPCSTESFSGRTPHAEWDSGQVGWVYVSKEDALKRVRRGQDDRCYPSESRRTDAQGRSRCVRRLSAGRMLWV